ncbi:MAG: hypothetical protein M1274_09195 [Actinobacteria bacterium]|nr:hypothetical protein [Actinomycetota bacterium]
MNDGGQLEERLKRLSWPVDRSGVWAGIEAQAGKDRLLPQERWPSMGKGVEQVRDRTQVLVPKASTPKRRSGLRVAIYASIAVVLVAAVAVGSLTAVRNLTRPDFVLAITDENVVSAGVASGEWERLPLPLLAKGETTHTVSVSALVMDPSDHAILYASTSEGLFKSSDGAGSWSQLPTIPGDVGVPFIDPASPSTIYVVCSIAPEADEAVSDHLLRSADGGMTWTDLTEAGAPRKGGDIWVATAFDTTTTPSTIYMWDDTGYVWRSTDRGTTWTRLSFDEGMQAFEEADSPRETPPIPAAAQQTLDAFLAPLDDWVDLTDADTEAVVGANGAPLVDPDHLSTFYAATFEGVYKSIDGGGTWRKASTGLPDVTDPPDPLDGAVNSILVDPTNPSTLYGTTNAGIYRSTDSGADWTLILESNGFSPQAPPARSSVVLAPSMPSRLYALTDAGLFRSDDSGTSWTRLNGAGLPTKNRSGIFGRLAFVLADQPDTLFAVSEDWVWSPFYLYRSTDAGNSWQRTDVAVTGPVNPDPLSVSRGVVTDPQDASTIYVLAGSDPNGDPSNRGDGHVYHVAKSADAGATWTDLAPSEWDVPVVDLSVDPHHPGVVWAIQNGLSDDEHSVVRRSTDGGATWEKVELDGRAERIMWLVFDPHAAGTLYAYTGGTGFWDGTLHRSTDGGASWVNIGENMPSWLETASLVPDPAPGGALYAATSDGLFKWVPGGE